MPSMAMTLPVLTRQAQRAWEDLKAGPAAHISTGLEALDCALLGLDSADSQDAALQGGVKRGQVTEIWGPPGCGKTALGIQLAANALSDGNGVVWVGRFDDLKEAIPLVSLPELTRKPRLLPKTAYAKNSKRA
ncbi:dna repair rhp55 [Trichoderma arundinaceum]|uniref:Dna repair rhp55 n=1 Tax=Trichoderma arundinaceum TaxID=490622 RepID=A0A395NFF7_TRIAR|nr:dna repair rhp55 [Trichoderma arundinaceum]